MEIIGILNLTPDSFSDGGRNFELGKALQHARSMLADGAAYIDVGAESTRPGARVISPEEEWQRLEGFLAAADGIPLSLDTRNFATAQKALALAGNSVKILNDVSGLADAQMLRLAAKHDIDIIVMHSLSVPANKNLVLATEPVPTLKNWVADKLAQLVTAGIGPKRIIFDVGLGFGKTAAQSMELVRSAPELAEFCHSHGTRILYGHSRKSFLNAAQGQLANKLDVETARITGYLCAAKVDFARVHDVPLNLNATKNGEALS